MMYTAINATVLDQISSEDRYILDVGCGTGGNAESIKKRFPDCVITGISNNPAELEIAKEHMAMTYNVNLDQLAGQLTGTSYDLVICSHILEHLYNPKETVEQLGRLLRPNGRIIIVVPNYAIWHSRIRLLLGKFEYADHGLYDRTHIRFFTHNTVASELVPPSLKVLKRVNAAHFPLPLVRPYVPARMVELMDRVALRFLPNLLSSELGLVLVKPHHS